MAETKKDIWAELRKPFKPEQIGKMPRGGIQLDYVGHANVTDRLNSVLGPENWNWEPMAFNEDGSPRYIARGQQAVLWGKFTINGVTKPAVGTASSNKMELEKELIGDLIRNGAMRFGVALDLWSKEELESHEGESRSHRETIDPPAPEEPSIQVKSVTNPLSKDQVQQLMDLAKSKGAKTKTEAVQLINGAALSKDFTKIDTEEFSKVRAAVLTTKLAEEEPF